MKTATKVILLFYSIYVLLIFILVMLLFFPFIMLALLFGKFKGGNIIYKLCKKWARTWYFFIGIKHHEIYEAPHATDKQYVFVANHISYMDIPPIVAGIHQPFRILGKAEMSNVPIFGWIYRAAVILVDRTTMKGRVKSIRNLKAALKNGLSIFIFPEGTFNETKMPLKKFYDGAFRMAIETQTPIKPVLFVDTIKRMHYRSLFEVTPGLNRVVYLEEIAVEGLTLDNLTALKNQVYNIMEEGLKRYIQYPTP
jgi:1-acyl-sn-glycerol-3-phosphate acyltransferase